MGQRNVGRLAGRDAQRNAHDLCAHGVKRSGFGVDGRERRLLDPGEPVVERGPVQHRVVFQITLHRAGGGVEHGGHCWLIVRHRAKQVAHASVFGFGGFDLGHRRRHNPAQRLHQALEAIGLVKIQQFVFVGLVQVQAGQRRQIGHPGVQVAIGFHGHERPALGQPVHRLAQVLARHALDVVGVFHQLVERAVFHQPFGSRLGAHLGHAGHVVHRVAHQGLVIDHERRRHAKLCGYARHITHLAVHGVDDGDVLIDQLAQILVTARHRDLDALLRGHMGQRGDHVIGFHTRHVQHGPAHQAHQFVDGLDLAAKVIGHGAAVGLVLGVQLVAKGRAFGVEHAHGIDGGHILAQPLHHVDHAANGPCGGARRIAWHGPQIGHGMEGAVQVAGAVDQQEGRLGCVGGVVAHPSIVYRVDTQVSKKDWGLGLCQGDAAKRSASEAWHRPGPRSPTTQTRPPDLPVCTGPTSADPAKADCAGPQRRFALPHRPRTVSPVQVIEGFAHFTIVIFSPQPALLLAL